MPDTQTVDASLSHRWFSQAIALGRDIKLSHSVFALPFALLATFLAAGSVGDWPGALQLVLIVLCMVAARTVAMSVNRLVDAPMDAANPRTQHRALPRGAMHRRFVIGAIALCSLLFIASASGFYWLDGNVWPMVLSPIVLAYLAGYSVTKRFTALCHLLLGSALALSPIAAVIAIEPGYLTSPVPWLLALMVTCWVAGFDVIYALQDLTFDCEHGVFSMPAKLGANGALWLSRALHAGAAGALIMVASFSALLHTWFALAAAAVIVLLVIEHALVWGSKTHRIPLAFLTVNGIISVVLGAAGIVDVAVAL
jgi:4-hydroxybenzoate polyprenyltransferase